ncbi:DUF4129 domain-containing protein [Flavisphingomonas formosensis]|uniref:DUF4129 domain-containing protein n=1 Tax=Flavisphingomonas formosensis TaxID=861534 RepID=UPI001E3FD9E1|nr:DUF4129 domain-containing protein [Sphingomonas formosensis]
MSGNSQEAAAAAERFAAAHAALKADGSIQFTLKPAPPPAEPPQWLIDMLRWIGRMLRPVGRFFRWLGSFLPDLPYAYILMWTVLGAAAALLIWMIVERLRHGEWRLPQRRRSATALDVPEEEPEWRPDAAPARAWLQEADALAAQGRYAEAVHHLLLRSVEDIARRRPRLVQPALTSRELASADAVPSGARLLFTGIAALVERSLFGGRPVSEREWQIARDDYSRFALAATWRG